MEEKAQSINGIESRLCYSLVADRLQDMNAELIQVKSMRFLVEYPWKAGKRLRPMVFLLSNMAISLERHGRVTADGRETRLSAAIELMHEASLVHDDIVDRSTMRRGVPTMHELNGEGLALLIGDYMIFRALKLVLDSAQSRQDILLAQELANTGLQIAHGQVEQLDNYLNRRSVADLMSMESYLDVIAKKTAAFFAGCAEAGAAMAGAPANLRLEFREFGMNLGIMFQILDDLMDVSGNPGTALKTLRNNLREGTVTLPMIHAQRLHPRNPSMLRLMDGKTLDAKDENKLYALFSTPEVLELCRETVMGHVAKAETHLGRMPRNIYQSGLTDLLYYVRECSWGGEAIAGTTAKISVKKGKSHGTGKKHR